MTIAADPARLRAIEEHRRILKNRKAKLRYGRRHREMRLLFAREVATGRARCARCGELIDPFEPWDADHDDYDERLYIGPSHARCNRAAANECKTSRDWLGALTLTGSPLPAWVRPRQSLTLSIA
jgi:hypothetical protein